MKKILIPIGAIFISGFSQAQLTNTENYVYTKTYLDYNGTTPSKTAETVQYFDGLGRPKQVVNVKASPQQKDVVTHIEYDGFGRQVKDYLPVPQSNTMNGAIISNPLSNATQPGIYGSEKIYSEKILENSPLDRIQQQIQVGNDWSQKPVKFDYDANIAGEVIKYTTTTTWENGATKSTINYSGSYGTAQLYKNTVTDEDGNKTIEFKNGQGQTVLVRKVLNASENADTYYVYNEYDQLAWVIPPLLSKMQTWGIESQNALAYEYRYDGRNRLVEKKLPGKGWEYMVYDKADRLIVSQDAIMRLDNKWLFTKYDKFGRVIYTGITIDQGSRESIQSWLEYHFPVNYEIGGSFNLSGLTIEYTDTNSYPTWMYKILSVNYYDTYPAGTPGFTPTLPGNTAITDNFTQNINTKSLPVASYVKNIEDDNWTKNYSWYDNKGRAIATHSINHLGGYTKTESQLDFSGTPKLVVTRHKRLDTDTERMITENFTYDHQNRLLTHTHQVDNNAVEYLAQNEYNELSQLKSKKVGGLSVNTPLQTVDYTYNIRGWMTGINNPNDLSGGDLFGYKIKYNQVEGQQMPNNDFSGLLVRPKYNGNIAEVDWRTNTTAGDNLRRYGYVYDGLNRLLAGFYQKDTNPFAKEYFEKLDYDLNGNITRLRRSEGLPSGSTTAMAIDNLRYDYDGDRLTKVTEEQIGNGKGYPYLATHNTITYDDNGNMTSHKDKSIASIQYNFLNLPYKITNTPGKFTRVIDYIYRADGVKVSKNYSQGANYKITDYLDGFQYEIVPSGLAGSELKFMPTSEGYYDFIKNKYIYNYADHLGNTRLSYFHNGSSIEVLEENNYYPFGLKHEGYNALAGNPSYQYKYQGQELQETGMYMFKYRTYMPDLGRFIQLDPLAEKFPYNSTYAIQENKMGMGIELEGLELLKNHTGFFAIHGNKMTVKQTPITQRDSFGRPSFRAGDIGLSTIGYNPGGPRMSSGTTGLKLDSYKYNGPVPDVVQMQNTRDKISNKGRQSFKTEKTGKEMWNLKQLAADNAISATSGIKEGVKLIKLGINIPDAFRSLNDYPQAVKDVQAVETQADFMGQAINYVDQSGINMSPQTRNDVVNFVFDGTLPPGTDTQNGLIIQNGLQILRDNKLPVNPSPEQENANRQILP